MTKEPTVRPELATEHSGVVIAAQEATRQWQDALERFNQAEAIMRAAKEDLLLYQSRKKQALQAVKAIARTMWTEHPKRALPNERSCGMGNQKLGLSMRSRLYGHCAGISNPEAKQ